MIRLNFLQYNPLDFELKKSLSLDSLITNLEFEALCKEFLNTLSFKKLKTFSFSKDGFLGLLLELKDKKIAISKSECEALIEASKLYETLGFDITYLPLKKDGSVDISSLKEQNFDYIFLSSYVMDTFLEVDLKEIKTFCSTKIVSNASANFCSFSDIIYFDNYKLSGYFLSGVLMFSDDSFSQNNIAFTDTLAIYSCFKSYQNIKKDINIKDIFLTKLQDRFKENLYFFVDNKNTLNNSFHIALKGIKARDIIRTLAFSNIFLSNGEGCSLGLSKPSRIVAEMGYEESICRNALSFSFNKNYSEEEIDFVVENLHKKYIQIKSLQE